MTALTRLLVQMHKPTGAELDEAAEHVGL